MRKMIGNVVLVVAIGLVASCVIMTNKMADQLNPQSLSISENSILVLDLEGIIFDSQEFLEHLREYAHRDRIRGLLIRVNSPGGVVGPSQEIYSELKNIREKLKKPIVVSAGGLAASGAYYVAVAADKIVTNPGTLMGSVGVIMEFANLEKLYDWAKIRRYSIKTGAYKDSGSDYREMREDEKTLFQQMANQVLDQFKAAIVEGRQLNPDKVTQYADGRIFTGQMAVELGFADQLGGFDDAVRLIGQLAGLGAKPKLVKPPPKKARLSDVISLSLLIEPKTPSAQQWSEVLFKTHLLGRPLYLMPGSWLGGSTH